MPRQNWNEGQALQSADINKIAPAIERMLFDRLAYQMCDRQTDFCFGDSFKVEYLSSSQVTVRAGLGFQTDGTQLNPEPEKRLVYLPGQVTKSVTAADASNSRIDIVCIKAARADSVTESKNIKAVDGTVAASSVTTQTDWEADLLVVAGTPSGSPAVPATPAGYLKLAEVTVTAVTGISGSSAITDKRTLYKKPSSYRSISTKTAAYTVDKDDETLLADLTAGAFAFTLPAPGLVVGKRFTFKKIDSTSNALSFSHNFDGASQTIDQQYTSITVESDGTGYYIV